MVSVVKYAFFLQFIIFFSCNGKKNELPTDLVKIPATADKGIDESRLPVIEFEHEEFDFGEITSGEKVVHDFKFKNTGNTDLIITEAHADCGCTVPEVPKNPIKPGESSQIRVVFDSEGREGLYKKEIFIMTNCIPAKRMVKVKVNIFAPGEKTRVQNN